MRQRLRTRPIGLLLAVLMLLSLLSGCSAWELPFTTDGGELPQRMNYQGSAPVDMVPFSKMEYAFHAVDHANQHIVDFGK